MAAIEVFREALQIDIGGVDATEEFGARLGAHVARRHRDRLHPALMARRRDVRGVFEEDHGVVVGESDGGAAEFDRGARDGLGRGLLRAGTNFAALRDFVVLAKGAGEIAARRSERQHRAAGVKVIERLLLDRIDAESGRQSVRRQDHMAVDVLPDIAEPALP